ncbi:hypothetical protein SAMN05720473_11334 [Fibrobacter sp. UWB15]|nr:hypothetical protein BGW99_11434 [Fibrobacter sp. UWB6]SHG57367.1 hypothetical protein SAMN05720760_11521 [Fibrobacter sp. UWB8]SMG42211.1 hypothetical protein SAMN05720473_11334 [Fibrobacter sp. UWB15]
MDQTIQELRQSLVDICQNGRYNGSTAVVESIPYIPYIPENWNGILVVAEAQNMSEKLYKNCTELQKICRLYPDKDCSKNHDASKGLFPELDVGPWEDGSIPLALKAAIKKFDPFKTAICNACLWSLRDGDKNVNPNKEMRELSKELWRKMLPALGSTVKQIICCGSVAASIFDFEEAKSKRTCLRLPSPNAMSRVSGMFREEDLFERYPEVKNVFAEFKDTTHRQNKIFYACHAVSILKRDSF